MCEMFMASKDLSQTPKKFYQPRNHSGSSSCRLCQSVGDTSHWKNLFGKANRPLLSVAEELSGTTLPRHEFMAHLLCRPCERRLKNFKNFKETILSSQVAHEQRFKRCIEVSPSAPRTLKSSKTADETARPTSRRGLAFSSPGRTSKEQQVCNICRFDRCRPVLKTTRAL